MPLSSIGDMRQHFLTTRANLSLKTDLQTLVQELTSGEKSDLTAHLGASQTKLNGFDRQLEMLGRFAQSNTDTAQLLSTMQLALDGVQGQREVSSAALLNINTESSLSQIENAGGIALASFRATAQTLNMRFGERSVFGGNDLNASPMADPDVMMDELRLAITGLTDATDIEAAIDTWFDAPGGGFETTGYLGDQTGVMTRTIDADQSVDVDVRADDQALRDTMKALAKGALAADGSLTLSLDTRQALQQQSGVDLFGVAASLTNLQARLGYAEGQVEEASVRIAAQQSSYSIARNDLVSADPFETATRLQAVQQQLETQYTLTARLSRLSLTEYLR